MVLVRDIQPSLIEWDGFLTNIVFTYGCNWRCRYCFQKDLLGKPDIILDNDKVFERLIHDRDKFDIDHIEIIGGEPTIYPDLPEFVKKLYNLGFRIMLATNGSSVSILEQVEPYVDFFAIDYKTTFAEYPNLIRAPFDKKTYLQSIEIAKRKLYTIRTTYLRGYHEPLIPQMAKELASLTDTEHWHAQIGLYKNTLDPSFKFQDSNSTQAMNFEFKVKKLMEGEANV